jgi:hypothetical protein
LNPVTRRKKLLLVFLLVLVVTQIPFVYRRYQLGRLQTAIQNLNAARAPQADQTGYTEYKGVMHVHSFLGGHSKGSFGDILKAAKSNQLDFVVMTEHPAADFNTAAMTLKGVHAGVLFVNGNEIAANTGERFLILPGDESGNAIGGPAAEVTSATKLRGAISLVAYPQEFKSWTSSEYDGVEVYNVYTNAREISPVVMFFDSLWSYRSYPDLLFARFYSRPAQNLQKWDEAMSGSGKRLVAVAGNDSHANIGINLIDSSGKTLLGLQLDPYERSFRLVRVHLLIAKDQPLNSETLVAALKAGHCFIGFDLFGDASGFNFGASNGSETKIQGDEIGLLNQVKLQAIAPVPARFVLLKDGRVINESVGLKMEFVADEKGSYRVEVYLPELPLVGRQPWIISNPIYIR